MLQLFTFVETQFSKMPRGVQVFTYLLFLCLFTYLIIKPKFITGYMQYERANGTFGDYRGGDLRLRVGPNTLKITTDERGFWSFPIFDSYPSSLEIHVRGRDEEYWQKLQIPLADVWFKQKNIIILFDEKRERNRFFLDQGSTHFSFIPSAHAGMLKKIYRDKPVTIRTSTGSANSMSMPPPAISPGIIQINAPSSIPQIQASIPLDDLKRRQRTETKRISDELCGVVSDITGEERQTITPKFKLIGKNISSYIEKLEIIETIEATYNIKIPDEHWQAITNIDEMATYIFDRQIIQSSPDIPEQTKQKLDNYDWPGFQSDYEQDEAPVFTIDDSSMLAE